MRSRSVGELMSAWSVDLTGARHWRVGPECDPPTCNLDPAPCITSLAPARTRITLVIHQIRFYSDLKMSCELCCNIISTHNCAAHSPATAMSTAVKMLRFVPSSAVSCQLSTCPDVDNSVDTCMAPCWICWYPTHCHGSTKTSTQESRPVKCGDWRVPQYQHWYFPKAATTVIQF